MSKYINADELIAEIKRYKNKADERLKIKGRTLSEEQKDLALQNLCGNLLHFVSTHQQEQSKVDLEKEIRDTCRGYRINDYHEQELGKQDIENIAHYFYELGLNARKEK